MNFFIRLKHYQLFLILLGLVITISVIDNPGPTRLKLVSNLLSFGMYVCWLWSVANFLSSRLNQGTKVLVATMLITFFCFASATIYQLLKFEAGFQPSIVIYVVFLTLLFYSLAKIGSLLKNVEKVNSMSYSRPFFYAILLFVFPIGVWVIQPKINKLAVEK